MTIFRREKNLRRLINYNLFLFRREKGVNVPEELAFVGFDEVAMVSHIFMPLTIVMQQTHRIGEIGARLPIERIEDRREKKEFSEIRHISVKTKLVIGDSCGAKLRMRTNGNARSKGNKSDNGKSDI